MLHDLARGWPREVAVIASPRADALCPLIWRWLNDARRRGLLEPHQTPPVASTSWWLTGEGDTWAGAMFRPGAHPLAARLALTTPSESEYPLCYESAARVAANREASLQETAIAYGRPVDGFAAPEGWTTC
jgi:hypothetical protein